MDDQVVGRAGAEDDAPGGEANDERYSTGIGKLDGAVHKIDAGVRRISQEIHAPPPAEDPARPRVSSGIQPLDNVVYKIDGGVRRISEGLHKAVDGRKK